MLEREIQSIASDIDQFQGELDALGIQLKDRRIGLIDFPSEMDGRRVLLCWRLGEPSVQYWHDLAAGFARRFATSLPLLRNRGRREDRVRAAPAVSCAIAQKKRAHEHTGPAESIRPSLRNGFTAYAVISPATSSSVCHRR